MQNFNINPGQSKDIVCTPVDGSGTPGTFDSGSNPAFAWSGPSQLVITPNPSPGAPLVNNQKANVAVQPNTAPGTYTVNVQFGVNSSPVFASFTVTVPQQPATTAAFAEV